MRFPRPYPIFARDFIDAAIAPILQKLNKYFSSVKNMEWDDLKHFLAVARSGSLTGAARMLKTSAATVGRRVAALERGLGARLVDRRQTGYFLTESGAAIRARAEEIEAAMLAVEQTALGHDLRPTGTVRLAATDDTAFCLIVPYLARLRRRHPGVALEIVGEMDVVNLSRREADIALRAVRPARGDFAIRRFGKWDFGLYAAKSYATSHALKPGLADLAGLDIITWNDDNAHVRGGPWLAEHGRDATVALKANSRRLQHAACKAGMGLAVLPCLLADREPDLVRLLPPERVMSVELWLVAPRDLLRARRVRAVMDFLAELGERSHREKSGDRQASRPPRASVDP